MCVCECPLIPERIALTVMRAASRPYAVHFLSLRPGSLCVLYISVCVCKFVCVSKWISNNFSVKNYCRFVSKKVSECNARSLLICAVILKVPPSLPLKCVSLFVSVKFITHHILFVHPLSALPNCSCLMMNTPTPLPPAIIAMLRRLQIKEAYLC